MDDTTAKWLSSIHNMSFISDVRSNFSKSDNEND